MELSKDYVMSSHMWLPVTELSNLSPYVHLKYSSQRKSGNNLTSDAWQSGCMIP